MRAAGVCVNLRRTLGDTFLETDPWSSPQPGVSLILLARAGANIEAWRGAVGDVQRDVAVVDVAAARLDGRPRCLGREAAAPSMRRPAMRAAMSSSWSTPIRAAVLRAAARVGRSRVHLGKRPRGCARQDANGDIAGGAFVLDPAGIGAAPCYGEPTGYGAWRGARDAAECLGGAIEAMAVQRELWVSLHGLDAAAFTTQGYDVDFCLRASDAGRRPVWHPGVVLRHAGTIHARAQPVPLDVDARDAAAMRARWGVRLAEDPAYNPNLAPVPHLFDLALPDAST